MVNRIQKFLNVMFFILIFITILTIITPTINASPYDIRHVNLLAVQEINNMTYVGSTADLYLEVRDGTGRVFLDTSPLTKIDTQISTRYAKDIACDYFDLDCDQYDFIYTIRAKSSIIGGPSAGAAMSALTAITVLDLEHDESVAVTGTINSGGIIGPVGAVEEKVITAFEHNLSKVLVSLGSTDQFSNEIKLKLGLDIDLINYNIFNVTNESSSEIIVIDYFNYSYGQVLDNELSLSYEEMDLEVKEVIDLNELVYELTNVQVSSDNYEIEVDSSYNDIMLDLAEQLCGRSEELEDLFKNNYQLSQNFSDLIEERRLAAEVAQANGDYYSAASFCFGINLEFTHEFYIEEDLNWKEQDLKISELEENIETVSDLLNSKEINTISDLQAKMAVVSRINEVEEILDNIDDATDPVFKLAYGKERLFSALSWMHFFEMTGKNFEMDQDSLNNACYQKIAEGEELLQYAKIYLPMIDLSRIEDKFNSANQHLFVDESELCLMKASEAKAEASTILSSLGITENNFENFYESKLAAVEREISKNTEEGIFPILGYSYYQYSKSLQDEDSYSSLLYLEYALELSELDIYFAEEESNSIFSYFKFNQDVMTFLNGLIQGLFIGCILAWLFFQYRKK
ncbi:hypothetical protein HN385_03050 [archaeon]|jgi:uncharacterized protein|nr:hypothetical protein [archaeon]MBT3450834.1 hypothetical protein [archaeon]MBT6868457.1 hypothetical protein [archaeon]MBT7193556.1 hypothetical protein [archaeon]MBT7381249.1 hypothetical protein [archaeon]